MKLLVVLMLFAFGANACGESNKTEVSQMRDSNKIKNESKNLVKGDVGIDQNINKTNSLELPEGCKRIKFKSGYIKYKQTGFATGEQVLYFDNYGFDNAIFQTMFINQQETKNIIYLTKDWIYQLNETEKKYFKVKNKDNQSFIQFFNETKDINKSIEKLMSQNEGKKLGTEMIAGKLCDIWQVRNAKSWLWEGLNLKTEMDFPFGQLIFTAYEIKVDVSVPKEKFIIPDYEYKLLDK